MKPSHGATRCFPPTTQPELYAAIPPPPRIVPRPPQLADRIDPKLTRDAFLNNKIRYESWALAINRQEAKVKKTEDLAVREKVVREKETEGENETKDQTEAEVVNEAKEKAKQERREQREFYEWMAQAFEEIVAKMDAKSPVLKESIWTDYLITLVEGDAQLVGVKKAIEEKKRVFRDWDFKVHLEKEQDYKNKTKEQSMSERLFLEEQNRAIETEEHMKERERMTEKKGVRALIQEVDSDED
jgi:hypothetical protein